MAPRAGRSCPAGPVVHGVVDLVDLRSTTCYTPVSDGTSTEVWSAVPCSLVQEAVVPPADRDLAASILVGHWGDRITTMTIQVGPNDPSLGRLLRMRPFVDPTRAVAHNPCAC